MLAEPLTLREVILSGKAKGILGLTCCDLFHERLYDVLLTRRAFELVGCQNFVGNYGCSDFFFFLAIRFITFYLHCALCIRLGRVVQSDGCRMEVAGIGVSVQKWFLVSVQDLIGQLVLAVRIVALVSKRAFIPLGPELAQHGLVLVWIRCWQLLRLSLWLPSSFLGH